MIKLHTHSQSFLSGSLHKKCTHNILYETLSTLILAAFPYSIALAHHGSIKQRNNETFKQQRADEMNVNGEIMPLLKMISFCEYCHFSVKLHNCTLISLKNRCIIKADFSF